MNINLGVSLIIYEIDLLHAAEEIVNLLFFLDLAAARASRAHRLSDAKEAN